ncbi:MAG TPA: hypothetical protein VEN99_08545 [Acidimicrobiia bacterium]|nr:hypothetical protein [Acidimicrobiia bacterium]
MLQMTSQAAATLARARANEGLPEHFGVRIFAAPAPETNSSQKGAYGFGFVEAPLPGDAVGKADDTPYFVAPEVADSLDDVVLDVADTGNLILAPASS